MKPPPPQLTPTTASDPFHRAIYLTGPTASGKTGVGVALAQRLDAEIIALDSMTLYRGMDVGTAKPSIEERKGVPHHLIDCLDPWEAASVAEYRRWAADLIPAIEASGRLVLFVGGTPLYLKTLLRGLFEGPPADPDLRDRLEAEAIEVGDEALHQRLRTADPSTAARLHPHDRRRVIRALEVQQLTGRPLSSWQREHDKPAPDSVPVFALERPRPVLHDRINRRVRQMFEDGLVEEVRRLLRLPEPIHSVPAQGVGYQEVIDYLEGRETSLEVIIGRIQARSRQLAKRQMTWFRGLQEVDLFLVGDHEGVDQIADRLLRVMNR